MKLLLGYGKKIQWDTGYLRISWDTRYLVDMVVFNKEREIALHAALWDTKIFIGIRDTIHRKMNNLVSLAMVRGKT